MPLVAKIVFREMFLKSFFDTQKEGEREREREREREERCLVTFVKANLISFS